MAGVTAGPAGAGLGVMRAAVIERAAASALSKREPSIAMAAVRSCVDVEPGRVAAGAAASASSLVRAQAVRRAAPRAA